MPSLRSVVAFLLAMLLPAAMASATWSIVIVDLVTGEVAVVIATCVSNYDLRPTTVVIVPGRGAAALQSTVASPARRLLIRNGLLLGTPAAQILAQLAAGDAAHAQRQYGIAGIDGSSATFTGAQTLAWAAGRTGQVGSLVYAIQGNVLAGDAVLNAAEQALLLTPGDLPEKLMAAMEAATAMGGDGRCSCNSNAPTACGTPPPSFAKASHIALMLVSRPGDVDAPCTDFGGCARGTYWLECNVANQPATALDAVQQLRAQLQAWRAVQVGRADHYRSEFAFVGGTVQPNGDVVMTAEVTLRDRNGNPVGNGAALTVAPVAGTPAGALTVGPVVAMPNGSYRVDLTAGFYTPDLELEVVATDAVGRAMLWPRPRFRIAELLPDCATGAVPAANGFADVVRVDGSAGEQRVASVATGQPFTIDVLPPPLSTSGGPAGMFALWVHYGVPPTGLQVPLGGSAGSLCFLPPPFSTAPAFLLADSFGFGGLFAVGPAPWSLSLGGVPFALGAVLQGVMYVDDTGTVAATNAVVLRVVPLPAPTIGSMTPSVPTVGQTVVLQGSNFLPGLTATLAGIDLPLTIVSPTSVQFAMPPAVPCDASLVLTNVGGASATRNGNPSPTVTTAPAAGSRNGGTSLVIQGQNLLGCTVEVHGTPMAIVAQAGSVLYGLLPPGAPGPGTLVVRGPNGCAVTRPFTYQ
jgi:hypothetical protein